MLFEHMIPRCLLHLDETVLGVLSLGDDATIGDPPRLGANGDEALFCVQARRRVLGMLAEESVEPGGHAPDGALVPRG